jgi:hypothetical protein
VQGCIPSPPNRAAPSNTIIPFHTCKLAARTFEEPAHPLCCRSLRAMTELLGCWAEQAVH